MILLPSHEYYKLRPACDGNTPSSHSHLSPLFLHSNSARYSACLHLQISYATSFIIIIIIIILIIVIVVIIIVVVDRAWKAQLGSRLQLGASCPNVYFQPGAKPKGNSQISINHLSRRSNPFSPPRNFTYVLHPATSLPASFARSSQSSPDEEDD